MLARRIAERTGILSLTEHSLKTVPPAALSLTNLKTLDLSCNALKLLPSLATLTLLKKLNLDSNKLTALPDLAVLAALVDLSAAKNELGPQSDAVPSLPPSLRQLDLSSNRLSAGEVLMSMLLFRQSGIQTCKCVLRFVMCTCACMNCGSFRQCH